MRRFAIFEAIAAQRGGEDWRRWPAPLRDGERDALAREGGASESEAVAFALFGQWLADRQLAAAAERAKAGGLEIGFYRDLAVGAAPDGAENWARAGELARNVSVGAPPDPFSTQGQIWNLPPPDPLASARDGWRGFSALIAANMRHAGMLRIDHAMGLTRLFVIPSGAKPAEGAYLAYPVDDLLGLVALESQRAQCMVVGEDLGTVPAGLPREADDAPTFSACACCGSSSAARSSRRPRTIPPCPSPASRPTICRRSPAGGRARTSPSVWASP